MYQTLFTNDLHKFHPFSISSFHNYKTLEHMKERERELTPKDHRREEEYHPPCPRIQAASLI